MVTIIDAYGRVSGGTHLNDDAIREEREACLAIVKLMKTSHEGCGPYDNGFRHAAEMIEQAIRSRK